MILKKDPIPVYVDGEWVKAKGTTLGSDNGMGVAAIMAIMETDLETRSADSADYCR